MLYLKYTFIAVGVICLSLYSTGFAATYYVDAASGNDSYAGSQAQPWKTIAKAGTTAKAGDIVLFRPGTYNGSLRPSYSGTSGNLITFKADTGCGCQGDFGQNKTGCQVIFDGQGSTGTAVELADRQYIRVEGFEIRNYTTCGVHATQSGGPPYKVSGCEIVNNYIHDLGNVASPSTSVEGISSGMCDTILLQNNEIYRSAGYGIGNGSCVNLHYLGNTIHSVGYDGFAFGNANASYPLSGIIERNRLYDSYAGDTHQDAFQVWGHINGLIIRYNSISDFTQLCYISTPDSDGPCQVQNIEIYGNVFFNDKYKSVMGADLQGIFFDGRGTRHEFERNIYIHDNTFGFLGYSPVWIYDESIDNVRIQNNAYYGTQGISDITAGATNVTISGNYAQPSKIPAWSGDPNGSANLPPTANAGPDQTVTDTDNNGSHSVTLNGSGSYDSDGSITSYVWKEGSTQIATGVTPSVTLAVGQHTITLTVTDNGGLTAADTVVITVQAPAANTPPTANAGPDQTVTDTDNNGSQSVTLNGSGSSDTGGSITSYVWKEASTQIATGVSPAVTLTVGQHTITLTVTDNGGLTATDTVVITVQAPTNTPPTANAGPDQTVTDTDNNGSHSVTLNGSGSSDANGSIMSYIWKEASTQKATGVTPTITLTVGQHTLTLTVTDNGGLTATDSVIITVQAPPNTPPTANAGPDQTVTDTDNNGSQSVTLNGSASSDTGGSITSYTWKEGSTQIATGVTPSVTLAVGQHTITLTVTDNGGLTATDTVVITVQAPTNTPPTANAGPDQTVTDTDNNGSHSITLNGSASSDTGGSIANYVWKEGSTQKATGVAPSVNLTVGQHTITLTVTDNGGLTATDSVVITVQPPANLPPNADANANQTLIDSDNNGSEQVTLDGSGSSDPGGSIASYIWTENGNQIASGVKPVLNLAVGQHTITLRVTDNGGLTDTDTVVITIEPSTADTKSPAILSTIATDLSVEIIFNEPVDVISATNLTNYSISGGISINSVRLDSEYNRVILDTSTLTQNTQYTLTVSGVKDTAGNAIPLTTTTCKYISGLIGYWTFEDISGTDVYDISGNNNTAALINDVQPTNQGEANFFGPTGAIQVSTADFNINQGTVMLWAKTRNLSGVQYLFGHNGADSTNTIQIYAEDGNLSLGMGNNHALASNFQSLAANSWYHIALTWNNSNYTMYVNGSVKSTGTFQSLTSLNSFADIGNNGNTSSRDEGFDGLIDEVRIYNREMSLFEISDYSMVFLPIGNKTVSEGNPLSFAIRTRPGVNVELADQNLPSLPAFAANTFSWTPDYNAAGSYEVEFSAPHGSSTDFERITITVDDSNVPDPNYNGPVGLWKFDETAGDIAADSSISNNTGILENGLTWDSAGKLNGALDFSVPNDAVEIETANFNPAAGTVSMWVYIDRQTLSRHYLFGHSDSKLNNRIQLYLKYGSLCLGLANSNTTAMNIQHLSNHTWYHVTLTWNKTAYSVYVNGQRKANGTFRGLTGFAQYAEIGNNGATRDKALNGKIDDVRIYNRALSANEITAIANVQ